MTIAAEQLEEDARILAETMHDKLSTVAWSKVSSSYREDMTAAARSAILKLGIELDDTARRRRHDAGIEAESEQDFYPGGEHGGPAD